MNEERVEHLRQQLDELLAMESIYGESFHIQCEHQANREQIQALLDAGIATLPSDHGSELQFAVTLECDTTEWKEQLESKEEEWKWPSLHVGFQLPGEYPDEAPRADLSLPSGGGLSRDELNTLTQEFQEHLEDLKGQECLFPALEWLQERWEQLGHEHALQRATKETKSSPEKQGMERVWMYFHHIYSSKKRSAIMALSNQLKLGGFCLSGKPGIICIEGPESACEEFVRQLRSWTWKRMTVRLREPIQEGQAFPETERRHGERCFATPLREIQLTPSDVRLFLQEHHCESLFSLLYQL